MPSEVVEVPGVSLGTVRKVLTTGKLVAVTDDACNVVRDLQEIDRRFYVHFDPHEEVFVLRLHISESDGSESEHFVGAYTSLDQRIVRAARQFTRPDFDLAGRYDELEAKAEKEHNDRMAEAFGDAAEKMAFALKQDLSRHEIGATRKSRAFIPKAYRR